MKIFSLLGVALLTGWLLTPSARAVGDDRKSLIQVSLQGSSTGADYEIYTSDEKTTMIVLADSPGTMSMAISQSMLVVPGNTYGVRIDSSTGTNPPTTSASFSVNIQTPPGFTVLVGTDNGSLPSLQSPVLNGTASVITDHTNNYVFYFQLVATSSLAPGPAGRITRLAVGDFVFGLGLGTLDNGRSAGQLEIRSDGRPTSSTYGLPSWLFSTDSVLLTASAIAGLNWTSAGSGSSKVETGQVKAVKTYNSATSYTLYFYAGDGAGGYNTTAYATYTVEKITSGYPSNYPSGADCMRITETQGSVTILHYVFRSASSDVWTLIEGTGSEERIEEHTSATVSGNRQETILVKNSSTTVITKIRRTWVPYLGSELLGQEEVWTDVAAGSAGLTTSYAYFSSGAGSAGKLSSVTHPDGGVVSFTYYDDDARLGQVKTVTEPWSTGTSTSDKVTTYDYTGPSSLLKEYVLSAETTIGGSGHTTAKATHSYDFTTTSPDSPARKLVRRTTTSYAAASSTLTTTTVSYSKDDGDYIFTDRPYSIQYPDGRQQVFRYEHGTYSSGTFTAGTGTAWRTWIVEGSHIGGTATTTISGLTFESIGLVANQSTLTEVIRKADDTVVSQKTYVYDGTSFDTSTPIATTANTWTDSVRQHTSTALNGVVQTWNWDGAYLTTAVDGTGIEQDYTYDSLGRVSTVTKAGVSALDGYPSQSDQTILYTYDAAGRVLTESHAGGSLSRSTTHTYDGAGRALSTTLPDGEVTSAAYTLISGGGIQTVTTLSNTGTVTSKTLVDGKTKEITGATGTDQYFSYTVESDGQITSRVDLASSSSSRWRKSKTDWLGRVTESRQPAFTGLSDMVTTNTYDGTSGLLTKIARTGLADELRIYGYLGQLTRAGLDVSANGTLSETDATDRVTDFSGSMFTKISSDWWALSEEKIYPTTSTSLVTGRNYTRLTGWSSGKIAETKQEDRFGVATTTKATLDASKKRVTTAVTYPGVTSADGTNVTINGLSTKTTSPDSRSVTATYDALGRLDHTVDSRTGTTAYTYLTHSSYATDQVGTVSVPVTSSANAVTTYTYDSGRVQSVQNPIGDLTYYTYDTSGRMTRQWGSAATPVEYVYNSYGQVSEQHTFRSISDGWTSNTWPTSPTADVTTMTYDGPTGLLTQKKDATNHSVDYTYNQQGQVATRLWSRTYSGNRVSTTYTYYGGTGELHTLTYNDGTPTATYTYDRMGLMASAQDIDDGSSPETRTFEYDSYQRLITEKNPAYQGSRWLTYTCEAASSSTVLGRTSGYTVGVTGNTAQDMTSLYAYDTAGRIGSLTATHSGVSARTFTYGYVSGSSLLSGLSGSTGTGYTYTQTRDYDPCRDLLNQFTTQFTVSGTPTTKSRYDYTFNTLGQRVTAKQSGDAYGDFGASTFFKYVYDSRGEVTTATGYLCVSEGVTDVSKPLPGRDYEFTYDAVGNRVTATNSSFLDYFTSNGLNQITARDNHAITVSGTLDANAKILVNGALASRQGNYWSADVVLNNSTGPAYNSAIPLHVGNAGSPDKKQIANVPGFIAPASEGTSYISYDADGNLTSDGRWMYAWDAENRLISMQTTSAAMTAYLPGKKLEFRYDSTGRRTSKKVSTWSGSAWTFYSDVRFVYQGWNLVAELTANSSGSVTGLARTYAWGLDLAGSLSATGGIGALVQMVDHTGTATAYLPGYDGSGNVAALMKSDGSIAAAYEYGPFGELLRKDGTYAAENPIRNATKYTDDESGYVYYGTRYYDPRNGRFVSRDTIGESGGLNLYAFVGNNGINRSDYLGQHDWAEQINDSVAYYANLAQTRELTADEQADYQYYLSEGGRVDAYETSVNSSAAQDASMWSMSSFHPDNSAALINAINNSLAAGCDAVAQSLAASAAASTAASVNAYLSSTAATLSSSAASTMASSINATVAAGQNSFSAANLAYVEAGAHLNASVTVGPLMGAPSASDGPTYSAAELAEVSARSVRERETGNERTSSANSAFAEIIRAFQAKSSALNSGATLGSLAPGAAVLPLGITLAAPAAIAAGAQAVTVGVNAANAARAAYSATMVYAGTDAGKARLQDLSDFITAVSGEYPGVYAPTTYGDLAGRAAVAIHERFDGK